MRLGGPQNRFGLFGEEKTSCLDRPDRSLDTTPIMLCGLPEGLWSCAFHKKSFTGPVSGKGSFLIVRCKEPLLQQDVEGPRDTAQLRYEIHVTC
jgi:hypothetical protein